MTELEKIFIEDNDWRFILDCLSKKSEFFSEYEILSSSNKLGNVISSSQETAEFHRKYLSARHWSYIAYLARNGINGIGLGPCPDQFVIGSCFVKKRRDVDENSIKLLRIFNYAWQESNRTFYRDDFLYFIDQKPSDFYFRTIECRGANLEWSKDRNQWIIKIDYFNPVEPDDGELAEGYERDLEEYWGLNSNELDDILYRSPDQIKLFWRTKNTSELNSRIFKDHRERYDESEIDNIGYIIASLNLQGISSDQDIVNNLIEEHNFHSNLGHPSVYKIEYVPDPRGWVYQITKGANCKNSREVLFRRCLYENQIKTLMNAPAYWQVDKLKLLHQGKIID